MLIWSLLWRLVCFWAAVAMAAVAAISVVYGKSSCIIRCTIAAADDLVVLRYYHHFVFVLICVNTQNPNSIFENAQ